MTEYKMMTDAEWEEMVAERIDEWAAEWEEERAYWWIVDHTENTED